MSPRITTRFTAALAAAAAATAMTACADQTVTDADPGQRAVEESVAASASAGADVTDQAPQADPTPPAGRAADPTPPQRARSGEAHPTGGAGTTPAGQADGTGQTKTVPVPERNSQKDVVIAELGGHVVECTFAPSQTSGACTADAPLWSDGTDTFTTARFSFGGGGGYPAQLDLVEGEQGGVDGETVRLAPGETAEVYGFYVVTASDGELTVTTRVPSDGTAADPSVLGSTVRLTAGQASLEQ